ncbi:MAG TPA: ABC transporter permease, partial [Saprospiraceae bacterium]|nr:ABC transporter permease [Saprospiraceae bacterium]
MMGHINFDIAKSLMAARWQQTGVAAVGVTFSITMFIALLGFMNGLNDLLDGLIINRTAHVRLFNDIRPNKNQPLLLQSTSSNTYHFIHSLKANSARQEIYNAPQIIEALQQDNRVTGIAPRLSAQILYNAGTIDITGVLNGVDGVAESNLFHFSDYISRGEVRDLNNIPNAIILGKGVAEKLLVEPGDVVQVTTSQGNKLSLKVVAFFQSGIAEYDKVQSFVSIETVQKLLGVSKSYISDIQIKLTDLALAPSMAKELSEVYHVNAEDIQTANEQFETGSFIRSLISYAVGITLLIVAG